MRIVNLTGHDVTIVTYEWNIIIPKIEWFKLQLPLTIQECGLILDNDSNKKIPIYNYKYKLAEDVLSIFAPKKKGTIYICSRVVAETTKRSDFYITGQHIKIDGKVIGTKWLQPNPYI